VVCLKVVVFLLIRIGRNHVVFVVYVMDVELSACVDVAIHVSGIQLR
jgi:hypothetical protein